MQQPQPEQQPPAQERRDYVFSVGILDQVSTDTVTLRFEDGATETYGVDSATSVQGQNADAQSLADLEPGTMVIVIANEHDATAVTIVNGGPEGFHEAGPADIRGHDQPECLPCDAEGPEAAP